MPLGNIEAIVLVRVLSVRGFALARCFRLAITNVILSSFGFGKTGAFGGALDVVVFLAEPGPLGHLNCPF
jgi:hypothetical protein